MKTYTACNSQYNHYNKTHPSDWCAQMAAQQYARKFKKFDQVSVLDEVGYGTHHIVGPFEIAQQKFYRG